jgi:hypothetical protein
MRQYRVFTTLFKNGKKKEEEQERGERERGMIENLQKGILCQIG